MIKLLTEKYHQLLSKTQVIDGIPPLLLRLYLAPVMMQAGWNKVIGFEDVVMWFGNTEWGLGLPFPALLAALAAGTELIGGALLVIGLATRLVVLPLMFTMLIAALTVHMENGWLAIADASSWLADGTILLNQNVVDSVDRLGAAKSILQEHGNYDWLTGSGNLVVLNNGIEFAATYFIMLSALFVIGGGRFFSVDYWLNKKLSSQA